MAGKITGMVLDHFHGDPLSKLIFLTLADRANEDALCWPSRGDICARSGASSATVTRKLRALDWEGAKEQLALWVRGGGRVLPGLVKRRAAEAALLGV